jgi:hypothetical protein
MTVEVLAVQLKVAEWEIGWTPVPDKAIEAGEFEALLATETLPVTLPVAAGAKVTLRVTTCPGVMICPLDNPIHVKPGPEIVTFEIVMLELPELVNVTGRRLLLTVLTLPKLKADALAVSGPGTVRVAALLVTLPTELLTTTLNCAPLSAVVVAGVV